MSNTFIEEDKVIMGTAVSLSGSAETSEGKLKKLLMLNGFPMYQEGYFLAGRCHIFERIGWDDNVGPTWLAISPENKELVLRVGNEKQPTAKVETAFLCKAEQNNQWSKFSQVHSIFYDDDCTFLALYFRGGPTLQQCFDFVKKRFSYGSAGRLAEDILEIVHTVHKLGYMMRSIELDQFHFDASSRHLFMADISNLRKFAEKEEKKIHMTWTGGPHFAPLTFHYDNIIHQRDEYEAWLYVFIHMVKELPWSGERFDDVKLSKIHALNGDLFANLPEQYRKIYDVINTESSEELLSDAEFEQIRALVVEIYQNVGGVTDHEDNFDFERNPTPDEIPRFVAEQIPLKEKNKDEKGNLNE